MALGHVGGSVKNVQSPCATDGGCVQRGRSLQTQALPPHRTEAGGGVVLGRRRSWATDTYGQRRYQPVRVRQQESVGPQHADPVGGRSHDPFFLLHYM